MAKVPAIVTMIACLLAAIFLLCSMSLLSSIIAWLSVEFRGPIPITLGFILGTFSLINAILAILMIGIAGIRKTLAFVFFIANGISLLASIALLIPWVVSYNTFCDTCLETERTMTCVDMCEDECCFRETSGPLAIIFVVFSALVLLSSLVGVVISVPFMRYSADSGSIKKS